MLTIIYNRKRYIAQFFRGCARLYSPVTGNFVKEIKLPDTLRVIGLAELDQADNTIAV